MKLISFDFPFKYDGVINSFKSRLNPYFVAYSFIHIRVKDYTRINPSTPKLYWTSATDYGCLSSLGWCASSRLAQNVNWKSGHPTYSQNPICVAASLSQEKVELMTESCTKEMFYICEARRKYVKMKLPKH
jgi:hypothetical protein